MKCLIDGDIGIYRVGFASQDVDVGFACARMDKWVEDILKANNTSEFSIFLTSEDKSNFRFHLFPEYKANRKVPKPLWYGELRAHLLAEWGATLVEGREADDAMADAQNKDTVICSIDKDLDQIPGRHYDFVKDVVYDVSPAQGTRFFYLQLLMGDRTDNVGGIEGVGPKGAAKILDNSDGDYFGACKRAYTEKYGVKRGEELMLLYGRLLKIGGDLWEFPEEENKEDTEADLNDLSVVS
jgi:DNA polymerase-1